MTGFGRLGIAQDEAWRRVVERQVEADVACGGDRRPAAERLGDRSGQTVGAAMAAQQRHGDAAVLGDRDHRRLGALVGEQRRQQPDHDAGGAQRQDRPAGPVEVAQACGQLVVGHGVRGFGHPAARHMERRVRQGLANPQRRRETSLAQQHDRRRCAHWSGPGGISTREK